MPPAVNPIPDGYPRLSPYLAVRGGARAIEFYTQVFGASERMRMPGQDASSIGHAELEFGDSLIMLADESVEQCHLSPQALGGSPVALTLYVEDVDVTFARALAAGATELMPIETKFYGDRSGSVVDPFGHHWHLMTHVEDVSPEEMMRRMAALPPMPAAAS